MLQQSNHSVLIDESDSDTFIDPPAQLDQDQQITLESLTIFAEIDRLEEIILNSPRVPLTGKTMVNEEELLIQLDRVRSNLPEVVGTAQQILQYKDRLIRDAQQQIQQVLIEANQRAYQVANELGIRNRAEDEAQRIRQIAIVECEHLRQQTTIEVNQSRNYHLQEMEQMREKTILECEDVQDGADEYADRVLREMECQLTSILQTIKDGRQCLNGKTLTTQPAAAGLDVVEENFLSSSVK
jgi:hypothetical protein